jgi:hypothetical protein
VSVQITDFATLLEAAAQQPEPQRFLFVFLQSSLPKFASEKEKRNFESGQGGQLTPVFCVDKALDELTDFPSLVEEAEQMGEDWQIVLVAAMSGKDGQMPTTEDAEEPLQHITNQVAMGESLSAYLAFQKDGCPVQFGFGSPPTS